MTLRLGFSATLASGVWLAAATALASPAANGGFGARARALAGAGTAVADDASAVFENPSALTLAAGSELSFGFGSNGYSFEDNQTAAALPHVDTVEFGLVIPGAIREIPVAFGFAMALPNGRLSRIQTAKPDEAYWPLAQGSSEMVDLGAAIAVRPWKPLLLGAGLGYVASLRGGFRITGTAVAVDRFGNEYDSDLHHAVEADLTSSRYLLLGASLVLSERLNLGLAYRGPARVDQEIAGGLEGTLRTGPLDIPIVYAFQTHATVAYSPAEVDFGIAYRPKAHTLVTADLAFQAYASYPTPYANTSSSLHAELPPGLEIELPPPVVGAEPPASGLENRLVPRLALEQTFEPTASLGLAGRLGYAFERSPVPRGQRGTLLLDLDRHDFCFGAGAELSGEGVPVQKIALDAFFTLALGVPRSISAGEAGEHEVTGSAIAGGFSLRLVFGSGRR